MALHLGPNLYQEIPLWYSYPRVPNLLQRTIRDIGGNLRVREVALLMELFEASYLLMNSLTTTLFLL